MYSMSFRSPMGLISKYSYRMRVNDGAVPGLLDNAIVRNLINNLVAKTTKKKNAFGNLINIIS